MSNLQRHKDCAMRSDSLIGNCLAIGGFCTSVSREICEALQNAYARGKHSVEVSEDCISRADAIKAYNEAVDELVKAEMEEFNLGDFTECSFNTTQLKLIARKIENAPSVVPQAKEGEWVVDIFDYKSVCPVCGAKETEFIYGTEMWYGLGESKYCPNCGAKMRGGKDD